MSAAAAAKDVNRLGGPRAWFIWFLAANAFFFSLFQRAAPSVMVDPLTAAFNVDSVAMGNLAALYLYVYAVMQLPASLLLERWGARVLISRGMLVTALGVAIFASADSIWVAYIGRFAIGAGAAVALLSTLTLAAEWHPSNRLGLFAGLTMGYALVGGFLGQGPLEIALEHFGWRVALLSTAVFGLVTALLIWLIVLDRPDGKGPRGGDAKSLALLLWRATTQGRNWVLGLYGATMAGPFFAYGLLWGVPHISVVHGLSLETAGFSVSLMTIGFAVACPLGGYFSDRIMRRKPPLVFAAGAAVVFWLLFLLVPNMSLWVFEVMIFMLGVFAGMLVLIMPTIRELSPGGGSNAVTGFVIALFVGGGALFQPLVGLMLDMVWDGAMDTARGVPLHTADDYQTALLVLPVSAVAAFILSLFVRESYCRQVEE